MIQRPEKSEAAEYYFKYIDLVPGADPEYAMQAQLEELLPFLSGISEEKSRHRYAPEKWSIKQVLNHITDTERAFQFRILWFGRGFDTPLPGLDQTTAAAGAEADSIAWSNHVEEFRAVRLSAISLLHNMPASAWRRSGVASGNRITVAALAYLIPGHAAHHAMILRERYL